MTELNSLLETESKRLEAELADLQEEIRQRADQVSRKKIRLELMQALLKEEAATENRESRPHVPRKRDDELPLSVCDLAEEILGEQDSVPMYYKDLAKEVMRRGGVLNGATPWANLSARLVQDERFVRPTAKGYYALRRDYPTARNVGARKKSVRGRTPSKAEPSHHGEVNE